MSMRLQAKLMEKLSSHIEESYLRQQDVVVLENVPAEMTFAATQGFMEHESQRHDYLPCYHMIGQIKEIRGDFPFNVTALYFSEADNQRLEKDIIYYPSPEELAHIIQTGKFYSKYFTVPPILSSNDYTLPCLVNLMIVPPPNQVSYEANLSSPFVDLEDEEKMNLPIFYIGLIGTGVSRKNDRLLDYYGIDIEPGYQHFVLTAESSGYTDPPLLEYMTAPVIEEQEQRQNVDEYYITPEEEAQMLHSAAERQAAAEREASAQVSLDAQADFHQASPEDAVIAQADRVISRRMGAKFEGKPMSLETLREIEKRQKGADEPVVEEEQAETEAQTDESFLGDEPKPETKLTEPDTLQQKAEVKMDLNTEGNAYVEEAREEKKEKGEDVLIEEHHETAKMQGADVEDAREQTKIDEAHAKDIALDAAVAQQQAEIAREEAVKAAQAKSKTPLDPQQQAEVKMDLNPESNRYVTDKRDADDKKPVGKEDVPKDRTDAEHMAGADVADAKAQAKVDEARARDAARDVAVEQQQQKHREVSDSMQEITDKYDKEKSDRQGGDTEYI